jgi:hypothetical protein
MKVILLILLLLGCSVSKKAVYPDVHSDNLQAQIDRMLPKLLWCEGMMTPPLPNNKTKQPNCSIGDGMIYTSILFSVKGWPQNLVDNWTSAVSRSIRSDGVPFRNPVYAQFPPDIDSFSRDQHIGLLHALTTTRDLSVADRYFKYVKNNNWEACVDSDGRCKLVTNYGKFLKWEGMLYAMDDVFKNISYGSIHRVNRVLDEQGLLFMAGTVPPGYQQHLVSQNIWLRVRTGNLTKGYAASASVLAKRMPNNLWFQALDTLTHGGNGARYNDIADQLTVCMDKWKEPGMHHMFSSDRSSSVCEERVEGANGHELVWLAYFLQNAKQNAFKDFLGD